MRWLASRVDRSEVKGVVVVIDRSARDGLAALQHNDLEGHACGRVEGKLTHELARGRELDQLARLVRVDVDGIIVRRKQVVVGCQREADRPVEMCRIRLRPAIFIQELSDLEVSDLCRPSGYKKAIIERVLGDADFLRRRKGRAPRGFFGRSICESRVEDPLRFASRRSHRLRGPGFLWRLTVRPCVLTLVTSWCLDVPPSFHLAQNVSLAPTSIILARAISRFVRTGAPSEPT